MARSGKIGSLRATFFIDRTMQTVFGIKKQQSQVFLEDGTRVPVTVVSIVDNIVTQHKTSEKDGYTALKIGIGQAKRLSKPVTSSLKNVNIDTLPKYLREVRVSNDDDLSTLTVGSKLSVSEILTPGDSLKATGTSKGKGFAGGVKRHGFGGGPKTHGQSDRHRAPGAIGQGTTPGRVYKGKRMAGRMGTDTVSVTNLYVVDIQGNDVYVSGLIPGSANTLIRLEKTGEKKHFVPVFRVKEEVSTQPSTTEEIQEEIVAPTETAQVEAAPQEPQQQPTVEEKPEEAIQPEEKKTTAANLSDVEEPVNVSESESVEASTTDENEKKEENENGGK